MPRAITSKSHARFRFVRRRVRSAPMPDTDAAGIIAGIHDRLKADHAARSNEIGETPVADRVFHADAASVLAEAEANYRDRIQAAYAGARTAAGSTPAMTPIIVVFRAAVRGPIDLPAAQAASDQWDTIASRVFNNWRSGPAADNTSPECVPLVMASQSLASAGEPFTLFTVACYFIAIFN